MQFTAEEGAGGENNPRRPEGQPHLGDCTSHPPIFYQQVINWLLEYRQIGLGLQYFANGVLVQYPVCLGPGGPHRRPFTLVQHPKLDAGPVCGPRHGAAQSIHFLYQVAFTDATNGGITGHLAQGIDTVSQQQGTAAHTRRSQAGLGAGMATTDNDDIKLLLVLHYLGPRVLHLLVARGAIIRGLRPLFKICSTVNNAPGTTGSLCA